MLRSILSRHLLPVVLSVATFAFAAVGPSYAGVVKYPADKPLLTMTVPDDWKSKTEDGTLYYFSPDGKVAIILSTALAADSGTVVESAKNFADGAKMTDVEVKDLGNDEDEDGKMTSAIAIGKKNGEDYVAFVFNMTLKNGKKVAAAIFGEKAAVFDDKTKEIANSLKAAK